MDNWPTEQAEKYRQAVGNRGPVVFYDIDDRLPANYFAYLQQERPDKVGITNETFGGLRALQSYSPIDESRKITIRKKDGKLKSRCTIGRGGTSKVAQRHEFPEGVLEDWRYWLSVIESGVVIENTSMFPFIIGRQ